MHVVGVSFSENTAFVRKLVCGSCVFKKKAIKNTTEMSRFHFSTNGNRELMGFLSRKSPLDPPRPPPSLPNLVHRRMLYLYNTQAERLFLQAITDVRSTIHLLIAALSHLARTSLFFFLAFLWGQFAFWHRGSRQFMSRQLCAK